MENEKMKFDASPTGNLGFSFEPFVFDFETTGFTGLPVHHKQHLPVQVSVRQISSGDEYTTVINPGDDVIIADASAAIHKITRHIATTEGVPLQTAIQEMITWVNDRKGEGKALMIAHNCPFDMAILFKTMKAHPDTLPWEFFDTLEAFRFHYKKIADNAHLEEYKGPPYFGHAYSLQSLMKHFDSDFSGTNSGFHSANFDTKCLQWLFVNFILPKEFHNLSCEAWNEACPFVIATTFSKNRHPPVCSFVTEIKYFKGARNALLNKYCNKEFQKGGETFKKYIVSEGMFTCAHIFTCAWMLVQRDLRIANKDLDEKFNYSKEIAMKIETMLIQELKMFKDHERLELLQAVFAQSGVEIVYWCVNHDLETRFVFPSLAGTPISYEPFCFDETQSKILWEEFHFASAYEMMSDYLLTPDCNASQWAIKINARLGADSVEVLNNAICDEKFKQLLSFSPSHT